MRVSVNLATLSSPRERYALAWAAPLALAGTLGLLMLSYAAARNFLNFHNIQKQSTSLIRQTQELTGREAALRKALDEPQDRAVFRKLRFVNALIDKKQLSLTQITVSVSKLLPPTVRLASMALSRPKDEMEVRFLVVGKSEEALEAFLGNLEESPDFQDFAVSNQGFQHSENAGSNVSIVCTARYLGSGAH